MRHAAPTFIAARHVAAPATAAQLISAVQQQAENKTFFDKAKLRNSTASSSLQSCDSIGGDKNRKKASDKRWPSNHPTGDCGDGKQTLPSRPNGGMYRTKKEILAERARRRPGSSRVTGVDSAVAPPVSAETQSPAAHLIGSVRPQVSMRCAVVGFGGLGLTYR
eukprot:GHVU01115188.1.p1 GENE.GHVU01115188.1~~GHVU01115188.1.p1  ORF type:complete len:164 (+),score=13.29 GHVU01115188.1:1152-1643(+)